MRVMLGVLVALVVASPAGATVHRIGLRHGEALIHHAADIDAAGWAASDWHPPITLTACQRPYAKVICNVTIGDYWYLSVDGVPERSTATYYAGYVNGKPMACMGILASCRVGPGGH